jgi:hypothetical protein
VEYSVEGITFINENPLPALFKVITREENLDDVRN